MRPLALALAFALALPLAQAAIPMPALREGDSWDERATQGGSVLSTSRTTVEARETIRGVDAWRVVSRMAFAPSDEPGAITNGTSTLWLRVSDGALVRQTLDSTFGADRAPTVEYRWDAPCARQRWPLDEGMSWEVDCTSVASDGQSYQGTSRLAVVRAERVEVPAGAFQALVVETTDADGAVTTREWIAEGACWPVRAEAIQPQGAPVVRELTTQSCGATAKEAPGPGAAALAGVLLLVAHSLRGVPRKRVLDLPKR